MYTVQYFIDKFEAIPEVDWTVDVQEDCYGRRCAYGHCNMGGKWDEYAAFSALDYRHAKYLRVGDFLKSDSQMQDAILADINNGLYSNYQEPTPKQRVLAALYDIKANMAVVEVQAIANKPTTTQPSLSPAL